MPRRTSDKQRHTTDPLAFAFVVDKISAHGEDAEPINQPGFMAVFDGMGGAGSEKFEVDGHEHTGAYLAARRVQQTTAQWAEQHRYAPLDVAGFRQTILDDLTAYHGTLKSQPSLIRSKMRRTLPTTLAAVRYRTRRRESEIDVLWAGDSRAYWLTAHGLRQLTQDDADVTPADDNLLASIMQDTPLNNCISINTDVTINHHRYRRQLPAIVFVCTDGVYGFLPSPVHVEHLMLTTLMQATSLNDWQQRIVAQLQPIVGDDMSMAAVCLGWSDLASVKRDLKARQRAVQQIVATLDTSVDQPVRETTFRKYWHTYQYRD
jgi:serine/threonine protein phosphatase PrpC